MKVFGLFAVALANPERLEKLKVLQNSHDLYLQIFQGHRDVFIQLAGNNTEMNDFTKSRITNFLDDLVDQAENASMNCTSSAEDVRLFEEEAPRALSSDDVCQLTNDLAKGKTDPSCSALTRII